MIAIEFYLFLYSMCQEKSSFGNVFKGTKPTREAAVLSSVSLPMILEILLL